MKTILAILMVTLILLLGCDTSPDLLVNNLENDFSKPSISLKQSVQIPLPNKSPLWADSIFTMSQVIDGSVGGRMIMQKYYISDAGDSIIIKSDLRIPEGAFQGTETITMIVDDEFASIHFYPKMVFDDTLRLFQSFEGLNLENYPTGTLDFVFIDDSGAIELIKKNGVQVVVPQGIIRVQNAKLAHFSKYGWVRKPVTDSIYQD
ncbi:MAG: hypothetical protein OQK56_06200 [Ignavibacteriaceae bacterium]|jgi:hypothetical protein|nr:hypothetical protein [Ignavibacteriaceae bacterium]MCW9066595.1 hypothetical protein [Ignavibacteriaceae bacterium]